MGSSPRTGPSPKPVVRLAWALLVGWSPDLPRPGGPGLRSITHGQNLPATAGDSKPALEWAQGGRLPVSQVQGPHAQLEPSSLLSSRSLRTTPRLIVGSKAQRGNQCCRRPSTCVLRPSSGHPLRVSLRVLRTYLLLHLARRSLLRRLWAQFGLRRGAGVIVLLVPASRGGALCRINRPSSAGVPIRDTAAVAREV